MRKSYWRDRALSAVERETDHLRRQVGNTINRTLNDLHADLQTMRVYLVEEKVEVALGFLDGLIEALE